MSSGTNRVCLPDEASPHPIAWSGSPSCQDYENDARRITLNARDRFTDDRPFD
jgi:hypothetical protein